MISILPTRARFVIVGGGAVGCGVAHALAEAGFSDSLLLERLGGVSEVTTSQGAGLCGQPRDSVQRINLAMLSAATFRELRRDPEVKPGWRKVGSMRVTFTEKCVQEFSHLAMNADEAGSETTLIDRTEAKRLSPLMDFTPRP